MIKNLMQLYLKYAVTFILFLSGCATLDKNTPDPNGYSKFFNDNIYFCSVSDLIRIEQNINTFFSNNETANNDDLNDFIHIKKIKTMVKFEKVLNINYPN